MCLLKRQVFCKMATGDSPFKLQNSLMASLAKLRVVGKHAWFCLKMVILPFKMEGSPLTQMVSFVYASFVYDMAVVVSLLNWCSFLPEGQSR